MRKRFIQFQNLRVRKYKKKKTSDAFFHETHSKYVLFSAHRFVRNGEFLSSFCTTCGQNSATIGSSHSFSEPVFVFTSSIRRLKCPFHCNDSLFISTNLSIGGAKVHIIFELRKFFPKKIPSKPSFCLLNSTDGGTAPDELQ